MLFRSMLMGFASVLLWSLFLVGRTHAQEVIVAREPKPEAPKQTASPPEQTPSETATPESERPKPKSRAKKSTSEVPTLEQMRMSGAHAAERLNNPSASQVTRSSQSDSEVAPSRSPVVSEAPRPAKRERRSERTEASRPTSTRTAKPDASGVVRPTFMDSLAESSQVRLFRQKGRHPDPPIDHVLRSRSQADGHQPNPAQRKFSCT